MFFFLKGQKRLTALYTLVNAFYFAIKNVTMLKGRIKCIIYMSSVLD